LRALSTALTQAAQVIPVTGISIFMVYFNSSEW
jgi:hypothetical protein